MTSPKQPLSLSFRSQIGRRRWLVALIPLPALALLSTAMADEKPKPPTAADYTTTSKPLLTKYCLPCHGSKDPSAGLDLTARSETLAAVQKDATLWRHALGRIQDRSMPPKGMPAPTDAERTALITQLDAVLRDAAERLAPRDPGNVAARRLNRAEYDNTIRDLTGVDLHLAQKTFPADGSGGGGFDNNADTLYLPPVLMERYLNAAETILSTATDKGIGLIPPSSKQPARNAARQTITRFATRAFRRPVASTDVDRLMLLYDSAIRRKVTYPQAVRNALKAVLISPRFLFRIESSPVSTASAGRIVPLDDYALASRLSYFLWSSLPDDRLLALAAAKRLHDPGVLAAETKRLLASPKSRALAENFAGQWLRIRDITSDTTAEKPDPNRFPEYSPELRQAMRDETVLFCDSVFREDRSLFTLIDADYTYVNERLAQHYGLTGITGKEMRRINLSDTRLGPARTARGGVLTQASVLTVTSYPLRTSPVLRGKWILNEILGTPPPPPPPVVATLPPDDAPKDGLTFRQRLEKHREKPECAGCHSRMDPLGFGLETFDPIGRWRDKIGDIAVDAAGTLPDGTTFTGPTQLKQVLLRTRRDDFERNISERLLSYALGRGLTDADASTVHKLTDTLKDKPLSQILIVGIVTSDPFRFRKS